MSNIFCNFLIYSDYFFPFTVYGFTAVKFYRFGNIASAYVIKSRLITERINVLSVGGKPEKMRSAE